MTAFSVAKLSTSNQLDILDDWESAVIDLFLNAANSFGLPKSYGQIYGLLFCRDQALSMDEVMDLLQISKGSASQGLRALRQLGAVSSVFAPGDSLRTQPNDWPHGVSGLAQSRCYSAHRCSPDGAARR